MVSCLGTFSPFLQEFPFCTIRRSYEIKATTVQLVLMHIFTTDSVARAVTSTISYILSITVSGFMLPSSAKLAKAVKDVSPSSPRNFRRDHDDGDDDDDQNRHTKFIQRTDVGMLGYGIYFADDPSVAAGYCDRQLDLTAEDDDRIYISVAEVALGRSKTYTSNRLGLTAPPDGYDSVVGRSANGMHLFLFLRIIVRNVSRGDNEYDEWSCAVV